MSSPGLLSPNRIPKIVPLVLVAVLGVLALVAYYAGLPAWGAIMVTALIAGLVMWGGWRVLRPAGAPAWLAWLVLAAALLRLGVGIVWQTVLPVAGYESAAENAGYVMADAYERDQAAWELANSGKSLWRAYGGGYRRADQYGGMLFLSALVYRYTGSPLHQPLLMVILGAAFSALAVAFSWALANLTWSSQAARGAALVMALYPEAVLLGSSQMRETFTLTLVVISFYGLFTLARRNSQSGLVWIVVGLIGCWFFSPPFAGLVLILLAVLGLSLGSRLFQPGWLAGRRMWLVLILLGGIILAGVWYGWRNYAPEGINNPLALLQWWIKRSAYWQAYLSERASGWVQKIFDSTPDWLHMPLLLGYGIVRPFLPAALGDVSGAVVWRTVAIWRAIGWTVLLPFLVYAPFLPFKRALSSAAPQAILTQRKTYLIFTAVVWASILVAAYRGGSDLWDNPRYRAAFAGLQVVLVAVIWASRRQVSGAGLRRTLVGLGLGLVWFLPWYFRRYLYWEWPVVDLFKLLALGLVSASLYWLWDWAGEQLSGINRVSHTQDDHSQDK